MKCSSFLVGLGAALLVQSTAQAQTRTVELASIDASGKVAVEINVSCEGENPVFRLVNQDIDWPKLAKVEVVRLSDNRVIVQRNMRMKSEQRATFKIPVNRVGEGEYGVRLLPSWYERSEEYDATADCK